MLRNVRREAFAQAMARGTAPIDACSEAGYGRWYKQAKRLSTNAEIIARIEEIREHEAGGGSDDLAPVIDALMSLAKKAAGLNTAAAMGAARGALAEAARLKQLLPKPKTAGEIEAEMQHEEWLEQFGIQSG